jgi:RND family efflux transporter MFP subunit
MELIDACSNETNFPEGEPHGFSSPLLRRYMNVTMHTQTQPPLASHAVDKPKATSSPWKWLLSIGLVVAAGAGATWWWTQGHASKAHPAAPGTASHHGASEGTPAPVRVEVIHPRSGGITRTSAQIGSVHWFEAAELYAKVSGYLKELSVDIGDRVKQGQVLAIIDNPEVIEEAAHAAAALEQAKASVTQSEAKIRTAEADVEAARAMVKKDEADIERYTSARHYRSKVLARFQGLLARKAVEQQVVDEQEEAYESAVAAEHSAQAEVFTAQAKVTSATATVEQFKADLAEAKANVDVAASNLAKAKVYVEYTKIVSPYTGVITFRGFHRGDFIVEGIRSSEGGTERPILTVARTDKVRVVTYVPDRDVPFTDVGDKAMVALDALPGEVFEGTVTRFAETEDTQSRTMRTEVDLPNPKDRLREGMYGITTIILDPSSEHLTVPTASLTGKTGQGEASIFVLRDGRAHLVPVKIGADDGLRVEILSNLGPEDNVILNPGQVADGVPAEPLELPAPAQPEASKK